MISIGGFEVVGTVLLLGTLTGMTYGLLAVGLVLVYRSSHVINFAHGEMGALGAAVLGLLVVKWRVPYWIAFLAALVVSGLAAAVAEVAVIRRLRNVPKVMSIVATLGVAQVLLIFSFMLNAEVGSGAGLFPQPAGLPSFDVGALLVTPAYFGMLLLSPLLVVALTLFLRRTRTGIAIRGSADNQEAARLAGIFSGRMSTLAWSIAGVVSAFTAILVFPTRGFISAEALGPSLLLRALVAAVVARMRSLPVAMAAGVGVGIVEHELLWNVQRGGVVEAVLFVAVLVALLLQRRTTERTEEKGSWIAVQAWPKAPEYLRKIWVIRHLGKLVAALGFGVAVFLGVIATHTAATSLVLVLSFALVAMSIGVVTGLAGQLSLGQFAIAGIGAGASAQIVAQTGNFLLGFLGAGLIAAGVAALIGLPALRIRGLMLAVTTLSFALAAQAWLLDQDFLFGEGGNPGRPIVGDVVFDTGRSYYFFGLVVFAIGLWFTHNIWKGGFGRRLRALRDNEENARAFTIPVTLVKLQGFALAGVLAGLGGALYGHLLSRLSGDAFLVGSSIDVVAMAVLGGLGFMAGPLIGALYILGVPEFVPLDNAGLAAQSLGWLILILYFPGGIAQVVRPLRDRIVGRLARVFGGPDAGWDPLLDGEGPPQDGKLGEDVRIGAGERPGADDEGTIILEASDLSKRFGGVQAVDGVDLHLTGGETLGLIGPNGAGKTTLFQLISGFTRPDSGTVLFYGKDVSALTPERRGRLGLIRSFQDASLFPTLTVLESVQLAMEREIPTRLGRTLVGLDRADRVREERAAEIVHLMGLDFYRHKQIRELSTGTRRITETACLIALKPKLLLLDEPSSGIAQRETEALGEVLERVKSYLGTTLLIIEHDMPLIMGLADRIIAMDSGKKIAEGMPAEVQRDPKVVDSYLGGDVVAIQRSGTGAAADERCAATTKKGARCRRRAIRNGLCRQHSRVSSIER